MSPKLLNILLVLLPVVLYYGYLDPYYTGNPGIVWTPEKSITALQAENIQYDNTLNQVALVKDAVEKLNKDYNSVDTQTRQGISQMLPDSIDIVKLRNEILTIGANSGVGIQALEVKDAKDVRTERGSANNYYRVVFNIRARYSVFKKFMENYEKNKRFFILEQAAISRIDFENKETSSKDVIDKELLNITITSRVYYMK